MRVAGDPERLHEAKVAEEGGITYHQNQIKDLVGCGLCLYRLPCSIIGIIIQNIILYALFLPFQWKLSKVLGVEPLKG